MTHGRSLSRFVASISQVPVRLNAQLGGVSMVAVVLGLDVVARVGRFGLGNASSEESVSGRLRLVFGGMGLSAARGALLACFLGGIVPVLYCISTFVGMGRRDDVTENKYLEQLSPVALSTA